MNTPSPATLQLEKVTKKYGEFLAVDNMNLEITGGQIFGLLGPNGAGKTTTFKMIAGLLTPTSGRIVINGFDLALDPLKAKASLGFAPDTPMLYDKLTALEFLTFVADLYMVEPARAKRRGTELLRLFDLGGHANDLIDTFSHGMKQKTALAASLIHDPPLLILDEPTAGLDPKSARLIKDILHQLAARGVTVILSTHVLEIAERMCDRIGIINKGVLIATGTMEELRRGEDGRDLEDIFLDLTGGTEYAEIAAVLD